MELSRPGPWRPTLLPRWLGILALVALVLLLFAVPAALNIGPPASPVVITALALGLGLLLLPLVDLPRPLARWWQPAHPTTWRRWVMAAVLLAAGGWCWLQAVHNTVGRVLDPAVARYGAVCWLVSLALYIGAVVLCYGLPRRRAGEARLPWRELVVVVALTLLALGLRLYDLENIPFPFGLVQDEGSVGVEAAAFMRDPNAELFTSGWSGQARLSFAPAGLVVALLGPTIFAIRLVPVLMGTAAVPLLYLLGRRMFGPFVGLLAAALLATWDYTIHFSRLGGNFIGDVLFACLVFWLVYRAAESRAPTDYLWAGLATGYTWYSYAGTRLLFLLAPLFIAFYWLREPGSWRLRAQSLVVFAGAALLVAGPQLIYYRDHLDIMNQRFNQTGIIQTGYLQMSLASGKQLVPVLLEQFLYTILAYVSISPSAWYLKGRPLLESTFAVLAVLGLGYSLLRVFEPRHWLLQTWFWAVIVIGGVLTTSPPYVGRLVMAAPAVCLFMAVAVAALVATARRYQPVPRRAAALVASGLVAVMLVSSVTYYFGVYVPRLYYANPHRDIGSEIAQGIVQYLRDRDVGQVYLAGEPRMPAKHTTLQYLLPNLRPIDVPQPITAATVPGLAAGERATFIAIADRRNELTAVATRYPGGVWTEVPRERGTEPLFYVYEVPEAAAAR